MTGKTRIVLGTFCSVTGYKRKIVAFLATVTLGIGALVVWSIQPTTAKPASENSKFKIQNSKPEAGSLLRDNSYFSANPANNPGTGELFLKMTISVLLVIAIGAAVVYISKRLLPKITNPPGKEIHIIETVHLGPRKVVHLIRIGNQRLLIGSTSEHITMLADVTEALSAVDSSAQERAPIFENINGR